MFQSLPKGFEAAVEQPVESIFSVQDTCDERNRPLAKPGPKWELLTIKDPTAGY